MVMLAPSSPRPERRNLDHAFPPFAPGLPSVYERAGFEIHPTKTRSRSGSRASSRASSLRKGSYASSAAGASTGSLHSQHSFASLPGNPREAPSSPSSDYAPHELQKPVASLADMRRPSSPLVNESTLKKPATAEPALLANPYRPAPAGEPAPTIAALAADQPGPLYNPYNAPAGRTLPADVPHLRVATQAEPRAGPAPSAASEDSISTTASSSPDQQTHSQSVSDASTATSEFEFDQKAAAPMMPLNVRPAWAQAQAQGQAPTQTSAQTFGAALQASPAQAGTDEARLTMPRPYAAAPAAGLLGVPAQNMNRFSTSSSVYSNRASVMPLAAHSHAYDDETSGYEHSESSMSFDFVDAPSHAPSHTSSTRLSSPGLYSEATANMSLESQESRNSDGSRTSSSGKKRKYCRGCMNPIMGKSVRSRDGALTGRWHKECFMCTRCEMPLTGSASDIHVHEDQPFCPGCYHVVAHTTCRMCGKGIEGSCLKASAEDGKSLLYHIHCLRCAECQIQLQQSYFEVDGATYCAEHAFTSLPQDTEVHKRFTQFMMI